MKEAPELAEPPKSQFEYSYAPSGEGKEKGSTPEDRTLTFLKLSGRRHEVEVGIIDLQLKSFESPQEARFKLQALRLLQEKLRHLIQRQEAVHRISNRAQDTRGRAGVALERRDTLERIIAQSSNELDALEKETEKTQEKITALKESVEQEKLDPVVKVFAADMGASLSPEMRSFLADRVAMLPADARMKLAAVVPRLAENTRNLEKMENIADSYGGKEALTEVAVEQAKIDDKTKIRALQAQLDEFRTKAALYERAKGMLDNNKGKTISWLGRTNANDKLIKEIRTALSAGVLDRSDTIVKEAAANLEPGSEFAEDYKKAQAAYNEEFSRRKKIAERIDQLASKTQAVSTFLQKAEPFREHAQELESSLFQIPELNKLPGDLVLQLTRQLIATLETETDPVKLQLADGQIERLKTVRSGFYWKAFETTHPKEFKELTARLDKEKLVRFAYQAPRT